MSVDSLFLISFLLHAFVGWTVAPDLAAVHPLLGMALLMLLLLSALLLPMGFIGQRIARPILSNVLTWLGLLCMGLGSSLFVLALLREVALLTAQGFHRLWPSVVPVTPSTSLRADTALMVPVLGLLVTLWGFFNARRTAEVMKVDVPIANLPAALQGFLIAQISDIHLGPTIKGPYLQRIVARVNSLDADLVAITGDLVDGSVAELGRDVLPLVNLTSTHGSFFVTGNHEYYSGAHDWIDALRGLGISVLMNEHVLIHHQCDTQDLEQVLMVVAGVTDFNADHFDNSHRSDPALAMAGVPDNTVFKLLLAHQPRSANAALQAGFDLQLSGHTHGGQFWPWNHFVKFQQPFTAGLHRLQSLWVYTSRGTGYWGPPKRFGAPSEITLLRLVRA
ncbi:metallophosphoesterase [Rhodoferax sp.]|uniref:metallophosphoesterase n=1 Tax=Rhodoferax sp. TaxID=50421 RepID=UPI00284D70E0|nr:metallophosphoesterase [Rhodoferax sp.]MDR3371713.1 metallophosphoesterase [Rhodoferax sp.]